MSIQQKGFSLVEMMVAVAIIGILSAFAYNTYQSQQEKVMRSLAKSSINNISQQLQTYYLKTKKKVSTKTAYEAFKTNATIPFQSPDDDPNYSKHFKTIIGETGIDKILFIAAEPQATSKYKVGAYYLPHNNELKSCKTNNKSYSPTNWTDCQK